MAKPLWTSAEIAAATGGTASCDFAVSGLSIDTRSLQAGDMFIALKDARDGHDFVANAFKSGASAAFVSRAVEGGPTLLVDDVLPALERLGRAARERAPNCYRVAVTGSVGKTSVKEMLARMFRAMGPAHWSVKSFNNHWGVPLTLARMPRETRRAVFEIGMNTPGEIAPRSHMVQPHCAIITKIAAVHLEGLGSVEAIAKEKADIFQGLQSGGFAIVPQNDPFTPLLTELARRFQPACKVLTFGPSPGADARVETITSDGRTTSARIVLHGKTADITLDAVGDHWAINAAAALLAVCPKDADNLAVAAEALSGYVPPDGRGKVETLPLAGGGSFTLVDDSYNANPTSMGAALRALAHRPATRRLAALGSMGELGPEAKRLHAEMKEDVLASTASTIWLSGENMKALAEVLPVSLDVQWSPAADPILEVLKKSLKNGDTLLLKGSNASGMVQLADRLRQWSVSADGQVMDRVAERNAGGSDAV